VNVVEMLLKNNANIESQQKNQLTPLHVACKKGHVNVVEMLLKNNANIESQEKNQQTPLHVACLFRKEKVVEMLLKETLNILKTIHNLPKELMTNIIKISSKILIFEMSKNSSKN